MSNELKRLREKCEVDIYRTAVLLGVWRELPAVAGDATVLHGRDHHCRICSRWSCETVRAHEDGCPVPALDAAIRHHLGGAW